MSELLFQCPACQSDIMPEDVLESIALEESNSATDVIENSNDVAHECEKCNSSVTIQSELVIVRISTNDTFLRILRTMKENEYEHGVAGWSEDFREALADERKAYDRKADIRKALNELKNESPDG